MLLIRLVGIIFAKDIGIFWRGPSTHVEDGGNKPQHMIWTAVAQSALSNDFTRLTLLLSIVIGTR